MVERSAKFRQGRRGQGRGWARTNRFLGLLCGLLAAGPGNAAEPGNRVAVVFNLRLPESKAVAEHYARRREIPGDNVIGLDLPATDTISRADFREKLQRPLMKALEERQLLFWRTQIKPAGSDKPGEVVRVADAGTLRYLTLCYGVPFRILSEPKLFEEGMDKLRPELRRNEAAVDNELALLPLGETARLSGPLKNPLYNAAAPEWFQATNGILMVARLDGPSPEIARGLVDKAMQAEQDGLWGRAYFDSRGINEGHYKLGDDWMRASAALVRRFGFETVLDDGPETFPTGYPLSQVALYAGWYEPHVSGPFTRSLVEFMPGAVAYHLHSFSGHEIRSAERFWVGPLLAKGVTATLGCVDEPYLEGTPDLPVFFSRLLKGFSFGEAAYAAQGSLSWQTTVVGDPLYRPFERPPPVQHADLVARKSKLIEWSHLRVVNLNLVTDLPVDQLITYLEREPLVQSSAVLQEKLGDIYESTNNLTRARAAYTRALELEPSPQQRLRLMLAQIRLAEKGERPETALELYQQFFASVPDYPDQRALYQRAIAFARKLGKRSELKSFQRALEALQKKKS